MRDGVRVLHVLPDDRARGAQVYARALCNAMGGVAAGQRVVTLFAGPVVAAAADDELGVPDGLLRRRAIDLRCSLRMLALLRRERPDAIVAHGAEVMKQLLPLAMLRRPPYVLYAIGTATPRAHRSAARILYRIVHRLPATVAAVSQEVADECVALFGVPPARVAVVPNGRPVLRLPARQPPGGRPPTLGFVGHLTAAKHPERFIELVAALRAEGYDGAAWIAGDGPLLDHLRAAAAAAGVDLLGRRDDVPELLAAADLVCFTSEPAGEGMPGVLIEAGLAGTAVVTTAVPGASTVVEDGRTGVVVPVGDAARLHTAVSALLADPQRRESMGHAARDRCVERFSLDAGVERWWTLLNRVTDPGASRHRLPPASSA